MKVTVYKPVELEIHTVRIEVELHDDVSESLPKHLFNDDGELDLLIEVDTGKVISWQGDVPVVIHDNICNNGIYTLFDKSGNEVGKIDNYYVPFDLIPGKRGEYIHIDISDDGIVTNWPDFPNVHEFFEPDL
jgi:hypothetical protein|uniref:Uncharacterized protein n=1 Tax=Podoviridae sp. ct8mF2 TaxID=2825224 RepID=A0A8S5PKX7_9CAUD|nr:MAG TPA: hypothetical protein [Podoviridae sp. ct8mF2]DAJ52225.1 MAG TPA: hypothetical protein [Caudoviricetes sp.]